MAIYQVVGFIRDRTTLQGLPKLRVEGWDKDRLSDDFLKSTTTDAQGKFFMEFNESFFQGLFLEQRPDLYFRVFYQEVLIASTEDSVLWNVKPGKTEVLIEIQDPRSPSLEPVLHHNEDNPTQYHGEFPMLLNIEEAIKKDAILYWNDVALQVGANDFTTIPPNLQPNTEQGGPTGNSRALAIIHLAMFDAFNSIAKLFTPYLTNIQPPAPDASKRAAIGEAASVTLQALYPKQTALIQAASQTFFAGLNTPTQRVEAGRAQGRHVAALMLDNRNNDGSTNNLPYTPSQEPGKHRVDPLNPGQGFLTPNWGKVKPFGITFFLADPPPDLTSPRYATDYNDVLGKGMMTGGTRTPEETAIGLFWAYDGAQKIGVPPRLYNQIVRTIAVQKNNTLAQNARLFALVNMSMADAGIQCWGSKYHYEVWRPVLGIREADAGWGPTGKGDNNSGTTVDPFWLPLGAPRTNQVGVNSFTPGFPAYPSGHATFGAASLDMVRLFYGADNIPFTFVSDELDGKSLDRDGSIRTRHERTFNTLSGAITENGRSRVYLGVHWQFDADGGIDSGKKIAKMLFDNFLKPVTPQGQY